MRPSVTEQLDGISAILTGVIADRLHDAYARDVLVNAASTLMTLSQTWHAIPEFLRWDSVSAAAILALIGEPVQPPPPHVFDIPALEQHHLDVRERLEKAMPIIADHPEARLAIVAHFRERISRFNSLAQQNY